MAVKKVDLYISQIMEDLSKGLTWYKKDAFGCGSIEEKYGANPSQISMIRKHPKLKDLETTITVFDIIDDTDETTIQTKESSSIRTDNKSSQSNVPVDGKESKMEIDVSNNTNEAANIFAQL